jgi:hypothetical protein
MNFLQRWWMNFSIRHLGARYVVYHPAHDRKGWCAACHRTTWMRQVPWRTDWRCAECGKAEGERDAR